MLEFDRDFLLGATLVGHSVEGGPFASDWWRWEQRPGRIRDGSNAQVAADHWSRCGADIDLARKLGIDALVLPVEWSRVQPEADSFCEEALAHYTAALEHMIAAGITPLCVLQHGAVPEWFAAGGGWRRREASARFGAYAETVAERFAGRCPWWLPTVDLLEHLWQGALGGRWPPGTRRPLRTLCQALPHAIEAETKAAEAIRRRAPDARIGVARRLRQGLPADPDRSWDFQAKRIYEAWPRLGLDPALDPFLKRLALSRKGEPGKRLRDATDFVGLTHTGAREIRFSPAAWACLGVEERDERPAHAGAFAAALASAAVFERPLLIAGDGLATADDGERCAFLLDRLAAVQQAQTAGLSIQGYFYHAFLDGFEWDWGFLRRYGLVHVDWETLARTPNPSAYLYGDLCRNRRLRPGTRARFCPAWQAPEERAS